MGTTGAADLFTPNSHRDTVFAFVCGNVLEFLAALPELMVFNDEAHHIHEFKREGESTEVEWQKSLSRISEAKGRRFVQVDFSATPYNDVGDDMDNTSATADDKENVRLIVSEIILDTFKALKLRYPETDAKHRQELQLIRDQLMKQAPSSR